MHKIDKLDSHGVSAAVPRPAPPLDSRAPRQVESLRLSTLFEKQHIGFALLFVTSGLAFWRPLDSLAHLAYASDYYSHTIFVPFLAGWLIYRKRATIFAEIQPPFGMGIPLLLAGVLLFVLQQTKMSWLSNETRLCLAILSVVLVWIGSFALCYGQRAFYTAFFPLLLLVLAVPFPMAAMNDVISVTRAGSAGVASAIFAAFGVPFFREGFLFILPGLSIEVAKQCSGIHSTMALFILTLMSGYLYLQSSWKRALLLLFVYPIVSLTNGLRIATLTLLAQYVDRNVLNSSLHLDGGILFFLLGFGLIAVGVRFLRSSADMTARWNPAAQSGQK